MRLAEVAVFGAVALGLHLAAAWHLPRPSGDDSPAARGAPAMVAISAPDAPLRALVDSWETPPDVAAEAAVAPPPAPGASPALPAAEAAPVAPVLPVAAGPPRAEQPPLRHAVPAEPVAPPAQQRPRRPVGPPEVAPSEPVAGAAGALALPPAEKAAGGTSGAAQAVFGAAVRAAIARAQVYPEALRARGVAGTATLEVTVERTGVLGTVRLAGSSGSAALDDASLAAARRARGIPPAPADLPGNRFSFVLRLVYDLD